MAEVKVNDQVTVRTPTRNRTTIIESGTVLSITGKTALVSMQGPMGSKIRTHRRISVDQLEPVSSRFTGRATVSPNPVRR